jgi:hypothetical protein
LPRAKRAGASHPEELCGGQVDDTLAMVGPVIEPHHGLVFPELDRAQLVDTAYSRALTRRKRRALHS